MPVNPSEQALFQKLAETPPPKPISEFSLSEFREMATLFDEYTGQPANIPYSEHQVPVRDGGQIRTRIYHSDLDRSPVLIFYPGCGYTVDLFEVNAIACSRIARYAHCKVILVDYRLAPEFPLPQSIYDGYYTIHPDS